MGLFASVALYNNAAGCLSPSPPPCQPQLFAGFGRGSGDIPVMWSYNSTTSVQIFASPIAFPGPDTPSSSVGFGGHLVPNLLPLHDYVNGRYHDPVFYAPKDTAKLLDVAPCFDTPDEFNGMIESCNPGWSSYARSAAGMFCPEVMRSNAAGGFQDPWGLVLPDAFLSPGLFQATHPALKTMMIEHSWLQGPPSSCNPAFFGCTPYYFNQGLLSSPATLFYDGHVRLLPNTEAFAADQQVLAQTGGVDGLWHRGTPFGDDGYFIGLGWDGTDVSHHVLTTDGILGRDTVADVPVAAAPSRIGPRALLAAPLSRLPAPVQPPYVAAE
jgi:hypothetical protein